MMSSRPELCPRAMSWTRAPYWPESGLMSLTPATTEGSVDIQGLLSLLWPCWCPKVILPPVPYRSEWPVLPLWPWWHLGLSCRRESCLGLGLCRSWGLWCYPLPVFTQQVIETTSVEIPGLPWSSHAIHWPWDRWFFTLLVQQKKFTLDTGNTILTSQGPFCSISSFQEKIFFSWLSQR